MSEAQIVVCLSKYFVCAWEIQIFLLICELTRCLLVAHSCMTLCDPKDCNPPGSSVYGISQARIPEWFTISSSRASSWPRDWTQVFCIAGRFFTIWITKEALIENEKTNHREDISKRHNLIRTVNQHTALSTHAASHQTAWYWPKWTEKMVMLYIILMHTYCFMEWC